MNIAIADDENAIRKYMRELIEKSGHQCHIEEYSSGEELIASDRKFDIVFLDIKMCGLNGIETARLLREKSEDTVLIFVTGIREYVFDALDLYAFQYLLKPIDANKFSEVLDRAVKELDKKSAKRELFIKTKKLTLNEADILYIESRGKKVEIHVVNSKQPIEVYAALDDIERELGDSFYRSHRSYIVNMLHITEYDNGSITVVGGDIVYLTKKKYSDFQKVYMWYLRNGGIPNV